ncbi:MAG: 2-ketoisovalerate ferredoxin oxidoreductase subunit delta [Pelotomaculum sp. PtaB.Bin013]|uniref:4Fe-4S binding protein n=2 Tax=Pelotomaculum TaxID=191373 RepID=A0A9X4JUX2_9FIRM|nr:4Fe-4S dicluster domain-containing protein [Pelotomaculum isophthalicicum]MDF9407106.1 4Fe-4S binding protein [Pelotomaculum isophthalicicum JI]OPX91170.1 MAG: 2-ketoisovalerate ferredoxin oxidoreductase subunit delta [Pelotomaculum sp. PtaB.Bin013]
MTMEFQPSTQETEKGFFTLFPGLCKGCGLCIEKCPKKSLDWSNVLGVYGTPSVRANNDCIACGICQNVCPDCAIHIEKKVKH